MTHLERVLTTLNHQEPDRVPIDFGGWLCGIKREVYAKLCAALGFDREEWTSYTPSEKILQHFDIDIRRVSPRAPECAKKRTNEDGSITDEWGITRAYINNDYQIVDFPLLFEGAKRN